MTKDLGYYTTVQECYEQAKLKGHTIFGVHMGLCRAAGPGDQYDKYGVAYNCNDGKGGVGANTVYRICNML